MFIESYAYVHGTEKVDGAMLIPELRRNKYMTAEYMKHFPELYKNINNKGKTAFIYLGGPASHHSDIRNINKLSQDARIAIKGQVGYNMYNVARVLNNIDYATVNANTCASGLHAIYEAERLFKDGYDDVIIYGEEMVEETLKELFKQLNITLMVGDAVAIMHLTKERTDKTIAEVTETAWAWNLETSPMTVSAEGYKKLLNQLDISEVDIVKPHGTGTVGNDAAEGAVLGELLRGKEVRAYKLMIGHTQGVSGLIEICMLLNEGYKDKTAVCMASGLGGHYGGCIIKL